MQSADGQVMIPSFHRPGIIRCDPERRRRLDSGVNQSGSQCTGGQLWADSAARILRPARPTATTRRRSPTCTRPDDRPDSLRRRQRRRRRARLGLARPRLSRPARLQRPALQAAVCLHGHRLERPDPAQHGGQPGRPGAGTPDTDPGDGRRQRRRPPTYYGGPSIASHLGNSISEVDPTYALQNAFDSTTGDRWPHSRPPPSACHPSARPATTYPSNSQVDNAGIDVRLTQLRNLLAGTRPHTTQASPATGEVNGDTNFVAYSLDDGQRRDTAVLHAQRDRRLPRHDQRDDATARRQYRCLPLCLRSTRPCPAAGARPSRFPVTSFPNPLIPCRRRTRPNSSTCVTSNYTNPVRAGYSFNIKRHHQWPAAAMPPTTISTRRPLPVSL